MSDFSDLILVKINNYKRIIKKHLPAKDYSEKINSLGLKGKYLKAHGEMALFDVAHKVLQDLELLMQKSQVQAADVYSGVDEFLMHMKQTLLEYRIHENQVVHISREASRSLVEAIQLIALPVSHLDEKIAAKLRSCGYIVARYGTAEQVRLYFNALKKHETKAQHFFYVLMMEFKSHVDDRVSQEAEG